MKKNAFPYICSFDLYLYQLILHQVVKVKLKIKGKMRITFHSYIFYWTHYGRAETRLAILKGGIY